MPIPLILKPAVGGLMLGVLAIWLPQVLAGGYGWIQMAIDGKLTMGLMLLLCCRQDLCHFVHDLVGGQRRRVCTFAVYWGNARRGVSAWRARSSSRGRSSIPKRLCSLAWADCFRASRGCR